MVWLVVRGAAALVLLLVVVSAADPKPQPGQSVQRDSPYATRCPSPGHPKTLKLQHVVEVTMAGQGLPPVIQDSPKPAQPGSASGLSRCLRLSVEGEVILHSQIGGQETENPEGATCRYVMELVLNSLVKAEGPGMHGADHEDEAVGRVLPALDAFHRWSVSAASKVAAPASDDQQQQQQPEDVPQQPTSDADSQQPEKQPQQPHAPKDLPGLHFTMGPHGTVRDVVMEGLPSDEEEASMVREAAWALLSLIETNTGELDNPPTEAFSALPEVQLGHNLRSGREYKVTTQFRAGVVAGGMTEFARTREFRPVEPSGQVFSVVQRDIHTQVFKFTGHGQGARPLDDVGIVYAQQLDVVRSVSSAPAPTDGPSRAHLSWELRTVTTLGDASEPGPRAARDAMLALQLPVLPPATVPRQPHSALMTVYVEKVHWSGPEQKVFVRVSADAGRSGVRLPDGTVGELWPQERYKAVLPVVGADVEFVATLFNAAGDGSDEEDKERKGATRLKLAEAAFKMLEPAKNPEESCQKVDLVPALVIGSATADPTGGGSGTVRLCFTVIPAALESIVAQQLKQGDSLPGASDPALKAPAELVALNEATQDEKDRTTEQPQQQQQEEPDKSADSSGGTDKSSDNPKDGGGGSSDEDHQGKGVAPQQPEEPGTKEPSKVADSTQQDEQRNEVRSEQDPKNTDTEPTKEPTKEPTEEPTKEPTKEANSNDQDEQLNEVRSEQNPKSTGKTDKTVLPRPQQSTTTPVDPDKTQPSKARFRSTAERQHDREEDDEAWLSPNPPSTLPRFLALRRRQRARARVVDETRLQQPGPNDPPSPQVSEAVHVAPTKEPERFSVGPAPLSQEFGTSELGGKLTLGVSGDVVTNSENQRIGSVSFDMEVLAHSGGYQFSAAHFSLSPQFNLGAVMHQDPVHWRADAVSPTHLQDSMVRLHELLGFRPVHGLPEEPTTPQAPKGQCAATPSFDVGTFSAVHQPLPDPEKDVGHNCLSSWRMSLLLWGGRWVLDQRISVKPAVQLGLDLCPDKAAEEFFTAGVSVQLNAGVHLELRPAVGLDMADTPLTLHGPESCAKGRGAQGRIGAAARVTLVDGTVSALYRAPLKNPSHGCSVARPEAKALGVEVELRAEAAVAAANSDYKAKVNRIAEQPLKFGPEWTAERCAASPVKPKV